MDLEDNCTFETKWKKRTRTAISLVQKLNIIKRAEQGERAVRIAETLGLASSSVRSILGNANKIKRIGKLTKSRSTERRVRTKPFLCPRKTPSSIVEVTATDETKNAFVCSFRHLVKRNGYKPQQVFNVAETVLFWKQMPAKHARSNKKEYLPEFRERVTLLLGGNANGDFKLKPLLVHYLDNPRALKGYPKEKLPVIWRTNKKTQITQLIFSDWFTGYFCPAVERYCRENNLPHKALLVLNDIPCHPTTLDDLSDNVKVIYLPQDTHDIWPLDQPILRTFKSHYLQRTLCQATAAIEAEKADSLVEFWDSYNIKEAISNISDAWEDMQASTMNLLWRNLYPDCIRYNFESVNVLETAIQNITDLANDLGVLDIDRCDILKLLESKSVEVTGDEVIQLEKLKAREEFMDEDYEDILPIKSLSPPLLREAMNHIEAAMAIYKEHDPDTERSTSVCRKMEKAVLSYRQLERIKKNGEQTFKEFYRSINSPNELLVSETQNEPASEIESTSYTFDVTFIKEEAPTP